MPVALGRFTDRGLLDFGLAGAQIRRLPISAARLSGCVAFAVVSAVSTIATDTVGLIFVPRVGGFRLG